MPPLVAPLSLVVLRFRRRWCTSRLTRNTRLPSAQLANINLENTEEHRRQLRELLFTTPGFEEKISGVILYCETLFQKASHKKGEEAIPLPQILLNKGVVVGVKVDLGLVDIPFTEGETVSLLATHAGKTSRYACHRVPTVLELGFATGMRESVPTGRHDRT